MKVKLLLTGFFLSVPIWLGINAFQQGAEDFFISQRIQINPSVLFAQAAGSFPRKTDGPLPKASQTEPVVSGRSVLSVWVDEKGGQKILYSKDSALVSPFASITKIMTAAVVFDNYDLSQEITFSKKAIETPEAFGNFKIGETLVVKDVLYSLLMESSNDAAAALAEVVGDEAFVSLMNLKAKEILGSSSRTIFYNPTGLDPEKAEEKINLSTAEDLARIAAYLYQNQPSLLDITKNSEFNLYSPDGVFHHKVKTTNELLGKLPGIIGAKTGETDAAGQCLLLVLESPNHRGFLVNVILGSQDRFGDMEKLVDWAKDAYSW